MAILPLLRTDQLVARSLYKVLRQHVVDHGYIPDDSLFADDEFTQYEAARQAIIQSKGYCIDLFSESSDRYKGMKNMPRIVILQSRVYDGEIGNPVNITIEKEPEGSNQIVWNDGSNWDDNMVWNAQVNKVYQKGIQAGKTANMIYAIHLISVTTEQNTVLNSILSNVLGTRMVIPYWADPTRYFFTYQSNFSDLDNPIDNIKEKAYFYTVPDAQMSGVRIIKDNIPALQQVDTITTHNNTVIDQDTIM